MSLNETFQYKRERRPSKLLCQEMGVVLIPMAPPAKYFFGRFIDSNFVMDPMIFPT